MTPQCSGRLLDGIACVIFVLERLEAPPHCVANPHETVLGLVDVQGEIKLGGGRVVGDFDQVNYVRPFVVHALLLCRGVRKFAQHDSVTCLIDSYYSFVDSGRSLKKDIGETVQAVAESLQAPFGDVVARHDDTVD